MNERMIGKYKFYKVLFCAVAANGDAKVFDADDFDDAAEIMIDMDRKYTKLYYFSSSQKIMKPMKMKVS